MRTSQEAINTGFGVKTIWTTLKMGNNPKMLPVLLFVKFSWPQKWFMITRSGFNVLCKTLDVIIKQVFIIQKYHFNNIEENGETSFFSMTENM